jgi:hypothetical protein
MEASKQKKKKIRRRLEKLMPHRVKKIGIARAWLH